MKVKWTIAQWTLFIVVTILFGYIFCVLPGCSPMKKSYQFHQVINDSTGKIDTSFSQVQQQHEVNKAEEEKQAERKIEVEVEDKNDSTEKKIAGVFGDSGQLIIKIPATTKIKKITVVDNTKEKKIDSTSIARRDSTGNKKTTLTTTHNVTTNETSNKKRGNVLPIIIISSVITALILLYICWRRRKRK